MRSIRTGTPRNAGGICEARMVTASRPPKRPVRTPLAVWITSSTDSAARATWPSRRFPSTPGPTPLRLQADLEVGRVSLAVGRHRQHQLVAALLEDAVTRVLQAGPAATRVRRLRVHLVGEALVEEELRREVLAVRRPDLEVDVHGAPLVPTRVDGGEGRRPVGVGRLEAAEELLADRVVGRDVGVDAAGVAVPDVHRGAREGGAAGGAEAGDPEGELEGGAGRGRAVGRVGADVGPVELLVHEVGTLGQLGLDSSPS